MITLCREHLGMQYPQTALKREDGATCGLARFQCLVSLLYLRQGESLVNVDFDFATLHHCKQVVGHGLGAFARGDVTEQGLTRDVQRPFVAQDAWRERCHRARGIAESGHQTKGTQAVQ